MSIKFFVVLVLFLACPALAAETEGPLWDDVVKERAIDVSQADGAVVQNRVVGKEGRFLILGPLGGISDRGDFTSIFGGSAAGRYHFTETHGWEFLRLSYSYPRDSDMAKEIWLKTGYKTDVQKSLFQLSSSYVFSPIYGKYAWGTNSVIHFDFFATAGAGLRFARDRGRPNQFYGEIGIGTSQYLWRKRLAIIPEYRLRMYQENRSQVVFVREGVAQLGVGWLF